MNLFDKRFVINTGKGGVGKSTITAAMALAAARRGRRVLAIELNTRERLSKLFGRDPIGPVITSIHKNIWAVNITPEAAMKEYILMKVRIEAVYRKVFENRVVKQFLKIVPGLNELVLLGKAAYHEQERDKRGEPVYDMMILDAPATGHGVFFLKIPQVITDAVPNTPMAEASREMLELLRDPDRTVLNLITLTEEMPVNETIELKSQVDETLDMPMGYLIANGIYPRLFTAKQAYQLTRLADAHANREDLPGRLMEAAIFRHERCDLQTGYLEHLQQHVAMPMIEVPFYFESDFDYEVISKMAYHIEGSVERLAGEP